MEKSVASLQARRASFALPAIAVCFLASAVLRGEVVAEAAAKVLEGGDKPVAMAAPPSFFNDKADRDPCGLSSLATRLKEREAEFAKREAALDEREAKLNVVTERLKTMTAALKEARSSLAKTVNQVDGAQARDIDHLVSMYSTMKPKRAGVLFNEMDVNFASELLVRTKPEAAAMILSNMDADKAFAISVIIARRNQYAPKN